MDPAWTAVIVVVVINIGLFVFGYGRLTSRVDAIGPLITALGARIDEVQKDIRELRGLIMGKADKS